jgi:CRISPR-associated protein Cmr5
MSTLEQERAKFALERIDAVVQAKKDLAKFKTQLVKLPARLHSNGLGQTVAFYLATGEGKPEVEICRWLETWLSRERNVYPAGKLIHCITGSALPEGADAEAKYREASAEARALAVWLKRFAEAFIADGSGAE